MIESKDFERITGTFPLLQLANSDLGVEFARDASFMRIPAKRDLMAVGDRADAIPLLVSGQVRVYMVGESGREITLYRFNRGECCVLTADAIIGHRLFPAIAHAEEESEMVLIPAPVFNEWLARHETWRSFVFDALSRRLAGVMLTLEEVAFRRMDMRVASLLVARSEAGNPIQLTHQEIANELGSSREVVSRILEDLKSRGLISLARGSIVITDRGRLATSTGL